MFTGKRRESEKYIEGMPTERKDGGWILLAFIVGILFGLVAFRSHITPTTHEFEHVKQTGTSFATGSVVLQETKGSHTFLS